MHDYQQLVSYQESIPFAYLVLDLYSLLENSIQRKMSIRYLHMQVLVDSMLLERTSSVRAHRVQSSVKKVSSPSVDLLQKAFVPATVDNTVLFNQVGSADDKIILAAGERKVTIRPIGFGSVLLSDTPPTNTATLSVSGAATNIERTFAEQCKSIRYQWRCWQSTGCKIHSTL